MNVVVVIDGREAVPVRAIPLLTNWETMSPDRVALALSWDEDAIGFEGLQALHLDAARKVVPATWWANMLWPKLRALSSEIKAHEVSIDAGRQLWRDKSLPLLPAGVFVWKDEFEPMHRSRYLLGRGRRVNKSGDAMDVDELERHASLDFDPFIPDPEMQRLVMEGFEPSAGLNSHNKVSEKPLQRSAAQDAAILAAIRDAGYDPVTLPVNEPGKPGVKAKIRKTMTANTIFVGTKVFDRAWERLRQRGDIADRA